MLSTRLAVTAVALLLGLGNHAEQPGCPSAVERDRPTLKAALAAAPRMAAPRMAAPRMAAPVNTFAVGQRSYRRSCVHCHGIRPEGLRYQDRSRFAQAVLQGSGQMPALGFKLTAGEVELIRRYVAGCAPDYQRC